MVFLHWRVSRTDKVETFVDRCVLVLKKKRNNRIEQELISKEHVYWPREQFSTKIGIRFYDQFVVWKSSSIDKENNQLKSIKFKKI